MNQDCDQGLQTINYAHLCRTLGRRKGYAEERGNVRDAEAAAETWTALLDGREDGRDAMLMLVRSLTPQLFDELRRMNCPVYMYQSVVDAIARLEHRGSRWKGELRRRALLGEKQRLPLGSYMTTAEVEAVTAQMFREAVDDGRERARTGMSIDDACPTADIQVPEAPADARLLSLMPARLSLLHLADILDPTLRNTLDFLESPLEIQEMILDALPDAVQAQLREGTRRGNMGIEAAKQRSYAILRHLRARPIITR